MVLFAEGSHRNDIAPAMTRIGVSRAARPKAGARAIGTIHRQEVKIQT